MMNGTMASFAAELIATPRWCGSTVWELLEWYVQHCTLGGWVEQCSEQ